MTVIPVWFEISALAVLSLILAADIFLAFRRPHIPSTRESAIWIGFYVVLALIFAVLLVVIGDVDHASEFLAGWLTEYSLSIDNLFVFLLIMSRFAVPRKYQQEILMVGILIALVLRGIFILLGAQLIENFSWIFYLFGLFLIYTAVNQAFTNHDDEMKNESRLIAFMRKRMAFTDTFEGAKIRTLVDGKKVLTPALIVFIALGSTDLVFALDSIPAIFGITTNPFIVFAANVFALMGLRQLYFLLGDLVEKLAYLKYGIAAILAFIGVKLFFHALHENQVPFLNGGHGVEWAPEISTLASLAFIVAAMAVAVLASVLRLRMDSRRARQQETS
jgi:tellurite resistance protein TerC